MTSCFVDLLIIHKMDATGRTGINHIWIIKYIAVWTKLIAYVLVCPSPVIHTRYITTMQGVVSFFLYKYVTLSLISFQFYFSLCIVQELKFSDACNQEEYGCSSSSSEAIGQYTITNKHGMKAKLIDYGASLVELWVPDRHGNAADVVLGWPDLKGMLLVPSAREISTPGAHPYMHWSYTNTCVMKMSSWEAHDWRIRYLTLNRVSFYFMVSTIKTSVRKLTISTPNNLSLIVYS